MAQVPCTLCNGILDDECTECFGRGVMEDRKTQTGQRDPRAYFGYDLPGEEWKPIPIYDKYHVSNMGRIVNTETGNLIKPTINNNGYLVFRTQYRYKPVAETLHRLIAKMFLPDYEEGRQVEFIDEDLNNVAVSNLRMGERNVRGRGKKNVVG